MAVRGQIGVDADDFRLPIKDGLRRAAELEFGAVEFATVEGELAPSNLSASGRRHLARYVHGLGLELSALVADMPGVTLTDPRRADERVARTCRVIELAREIGAPVVTASVGALTHPETKAASPLAVEALARIGECADECGVTFAIRPSYDTADRVANVLTVLRCPSLHVGLDPAAMVMAGVNPLASFEQIADHVRLFHARDATAGFPDRPGHETRLGAGEVDLPRVLAMLNAAEYEGPLILRRVDSTTPVQDLTVARDAILREMGRL
jgi:sugar phosphate isomerase/epimerase